MRDNNGNFSNNLGKDNFVVFLDPESLIYYRMYLNNPSFIKIEHYIDPQAAKDDPLHKRDSKVRKNIKLLLDLPKFHWDFRAAEFYRRRQFPAKFL